MRKIVTRISNRRESVERFLSFIALAASAIGIFAAENVVIIITSSLMVIFVMYLLLTSAKPEPVPVIEHRTEKPYRLHIPSSNQELEQAIEIAQDFFAPHAIDPNHVREIYKVSPSSFMTVVDIKKGRVIGYADIYTSTSENFGKFIAGNIAEDQLSADDFKEASPKNSQFYIGAIAVEENGLSTRGKCAEALIYGIIEYILKNSSSDFVDIYSIGFTREGRSLLTKLGFVSLGKRAAQDGEGFSRRVSRKYLVRARKDFAVSHYYADYRYD